MKFLRYFLFPFSIIYNMVTKIRNFFFDVGIFKETRFKLPVIVVGNLSVGGTGKTPQIEYLIRLLHESFKVSVLSRGYRRNTKGYILLNDTHNALNVGDEPLQYFNKFNNINVAVHSSRVEGVANLISDKNPEVILLDDAFQHRKIKASFYILLSKYKDLFVDDFILPTGNLRESRDGAHRSDVILITKCPENLSIHDQELIKRKLKRYKKEVFFTSISYGKILKGNLTISIEELKNYNVLLVTGIANPNLLLDYLKINDVNFKHLKYKDHHTFTKSELESIAHEYENIKSNKKIILTTEKDYTRLEGELENLSYIAIETKFLDNQDQIFDKIIRAHIQQNRC